MHSPVARKTSSFARAWSSGPRSGPPQAVMPAKAGIDASRSATPARWAPAFAGAIGREVSARSPDGISRLDFLEMTGTADDIKGIWMHDRPRQVNFRKYIYPLWVVFKRNRSRSQAVEDILEMDGDHPMSVSVFGDYEVCPLERERPGWMRAVCIESASRLVATNWEGKIIERR